MKSLRFLDRRAGYSLASIGLLLGMVAPAVFPAFASADQITSRSIQMSSSATGAQNVDYEVTFTPATSLTGGDIVLWFCQNTPLVAQTCSAPSGLDLSGASLASPPGSESILTTSYTGAGANYLVISDADMTANSAYTITVSGVTNPSTAGTFYGRIETFVNDAAAELAGGDAAHGGTADGSVITSVKDDGSVALSATPSIGVTAAVLESLTFCVFGDPNNNTASADGTADDADYLAAQTDDTNGPTSNCTSNGVPNPSVALGEVSNDISSLSTSKESYAAGWAQLSTNASGGAAVYLKTSNQCVGLHRSGQSVATTCEIPDPANGGTEGGSIAAGTPGFGLSFGDAVSAGDNSTGSIEINTNYASGSYAMLSTATTTSGYATADNGLSQNTTSTYGGFVFGSEGDPVADKDVPFAYGAAISNNTPAGNYSADLSLIAVGTF